MLNPFSIRLNAMPEQAILTKATNVTPAEYGKHPTGEGYFIAPATLVFMAIKQLSTGWAAVVRPIWRGEFTGAHSVLQRRPQADKLWEEITL